MQKNIKKKEEQRKLHYESSIYNNEKVHWCHSQIFKKEKKFQKIFLYKIKISEKEKCLLILPSKIFDFFDFYIFTENSEIREKCVIEYLREEKIEIKKFKKFYDFHKYFFSDLKKKSLYLLGKEVLEYKEVFKKNDKLIPIGFILPLIINENYNEKENEKENEDFKEKKNDQEKNFLENNSLFEDDQEKNFSENNSLFEDLDNFQIKKKEKNQNLKKSKKYRINEKLITLYLQNRLLKTNLNKNIYENDIVQSNNDSRTMYKVLKIIKNPKELTMLDYYKILSKKYKIENLEKIAENYNLNFLETKDKNFFNYLLNNDDLPHNIKNQFSMTFLKNLEKNSNCDIYLMSDILGCDSFKVHKRFKKTKKSLQIFSKKAFPRLAFKKDISKYFLQEQNLLFWMKIPSTIKVFYRFSRILNFFEILEIFPKKSFTFFLESLTTSQKDNKYNLESLETIGDSILKLITAFFIYIKFPKKDERHLTVLKSKLISNIFYSEIGKNLGLHFFLFVNSKSNINFPLFDENKINEEIISYKITKKNLSDSFEAIIASFFFDNKCLFFIFRFLISFTNIFLHCENNDFFFDFQKNQNNKFEKKDCYTHFENVLLNKKWKKKIFFNIFKQNIDYFFFEDFQGFTKNSTLRDLLEKIGFDKKFYKIEKTENLTLKNFEEILGYEFKNKNLLENCLILKNKDFERLEFFGDIIQEFIILTESGKILLKNDKKIKPKFLQKIKRQFLSNLSMYKFAHLFCFQKFINLKNLNEKEKIEFNSSFFEIDLEISILDFLKKKKNDFFFVNKKIADVWESITAAILIDGGFHAMKNNFFLFLAPFFKFYLIFEKDL